MSEYNKCDVCDVESEDVVAGRWLFYCPKHEQNDIDMTMENEILPDLESGNLYYLLNDGELSDIAEKALFGIPLKPKEDSK